MHFVRMPPLMRTIIMLVSCTYWIKGTLYFLLGMLKYSFQEVIGRNIHVVNVAVMYGIFCGITPPVNRILFLVF